jgi:hypothetical protein
MLQMGSAPYRHIQSRSIARSDFGTCDEMYDNVPHDLAEVRFSIILT